MKSREKIVIVGGSTGIGLQLARRLYSVNNDLIIASRSIKKLKEVKKELDLVDIYQLDANNEEEVAKFAEQTGETDHLIVTLRGTTITTLFKESITAEVRKAFEEKFWTQYYIVRQFISKMKPTGSIILSTGIASQRGYKGFYWHAAANGAIEAVIKSLSSEIAPVRINAVSPAFVENKPNDDEKFKAINKVEPKIPLNRLATANEIVEGYLYLMKCTYTTGTTLTIDGGILSV